MNRPGRLHALLEELTRRRVIRTAALYLAGAFLVLQAADLVFQAEFFPGWAYSATVLLAGLGFPIALVLAWAFDWTPEGVRRSDEGIGTRGSTDTGTVRLARMLLAVVVIAVTAGTGLYAWDGLLRPSSGVVAVGDRASGTSDLDPLRIAVLYLDNRTREDSLDYLAHGLTDGLITALGGVESVSVASRNAVRAVAEGRRTVDALMTELGAGTYVDGTLSRAGDELRVDVQLVDARTGYALSTHTLSRPASAPLALRDTLVVELSEALRRRLGVEVRARTLAAAGVTEHSWILVQRADRILDEVGELWDSGPEAAHAALDRADSLLAEAETGSGQWVVPVLRRGWLEYVRSRYETTTPGDVAATPALRGLGHAERALVMRPGNHAAALELRGTLRSSLATTMEEKAARDRMLRLAREDLTRAVDEHPHLARAWWNLSEVYRLQGEFDLSLRAAERALAEDAFLEDALQIYRQLFYTAFEQEQNDRAARWCAEGRRRFPHRGDMILCQLLILATVDTIAPEPATIAAIADTLVRSVPPGDSGAWRAYADMQLAKTYARAGRTDSAEALIHRAHGGAFQAWLGYDEAHARLLLGQRDSALTLLAGYLEMQPDRAGYWSRDWWLRDLWTDPRFLDLIGATGAD